MVCDFFRGHETQTVNQWKFPWLSWGISCWQVGENTAGRKQQLSQEWEQSGLSKKEFCKSKGIKLTSFYVMSSKVARTKQSATKDLVKIVLPTKSGSPLIQERITIRVDHRTAIEVTSIDTLQKVLAMLGVAVCSSI